MSRKREKTIYNNTNQDTITIIPYEVSTETVVKVENANGHLLVLPFGRTRDGNGVAAIRNDLIDSFICALKALRPCKCNEKSHDCSESIADEIRSAVECGKQITIKIK